MTFRTQSLIPFALLLALGGCTGQLGDLDDDAPAAGDASAPSDAAAPLATTADAAPRPTRDAGATATNDARAPAADASTNDASAAVAPAVDAPAVDAPAANDAPAYPGVPGVSPTLGGCAVFPPDNPWNRDVHAAAVYPNSAAIIANILAHGDSELRADFGATPGYGIPITIASAAQASAPVTVTEYPSESDTGRFPIPANATIEAGNDDHVLVVSPVTCVLYELYHARYSASGWSAGSVATFDLRSNATRPAGWTSADQAGLPIAPGLARVDEVNAGEIRHALRVTFEHTRAAWVYPATHPGGSDDADAPAMGMRLRLRANFDTSALPGQARVIADALKRYGMFVADTGTNWFVSGASDARWNDQDLLRLRDIPGAAFEVVDTGPPRT